MRRILALALVLTSCTLPIVPASDEPVDAASSLHLTFTYSADERASVSDLDLSVPATLEQLLTWDSIAMGVVAREQLPPTTASQLYSTLAVAQRDAATLAGGVPPASAIDRISRDTTCRFAAESCNGLRSRFQFPMEADPLSTLVLRKVDARLAELWKQRSAPVRPPGSEYWSGTKTVTPTAGGWPRWADGYFPHVLAPPDIGSEKDAAELRAVRAAVARITPSQVATVYAWAGSAGSETPGGLWLRRADAVLRERATPLAEALDLRAQLTMAIADAFIACWDVKFTHWSARPDERDTSIQPLIPTPSFPSYPSGHATISGAAAEVLAAWDIDNAPSYYAAAEEAANSRVWAGIHFPIDSSAGLQLGRAIGRQVLHGED